MKPAPKDAGFELIACGLLLAIAGGLLHRMDPTADCRLLMISVIGGGMCLAAGLLALRQRRWVLGGVGLLLLLGGALGWQAWQAWHEHATGETVSRMVPVVTSALCLVTLALGGLLWSASRNEE